MVLRWFLATAHLLALGIGLGAVWARAQALRSPLNNPDGLRRVFAADAWWGIAALLWLSTGLWRLFGATEKATEYYLQNHVFWTKMTLFGLVLVLELWPMTTLIGWRRRLARGEAVDVKRAGLLSRISFAEAGLVVLIILAATAMARGFGVWSG